MKWMDRLAVLVLVAGVGVAAAVGGLQLWERFGGGAGNQDSLLSYVPADTVFYFGSKDPFPNAEVARAFGGADLGPYDFDALQAGLADATPGLRLVIALATELQLAAAKGDYVGGVGLPEKGRSAVYAVGAMPVATFELGDVAAFEAFLGRAEQRAGVTAEAGAFRGLAYRRYPLLEADAEQRLDLIVLQSEGVARLLLDSADIADDAQRAIAFGLEQPADSLATSDKLQQLISARGYLPSALGYFSHVELIKGLAVPGGNRLSAMVDRLLGESPDDADLDWLRSLRGECRADALAIADLWPGVSFGYTALELGKSPRMDMDMVIESRDAATMELLRSLRGYLPAHLGNVGMIGFGVGVDVGALPAVLGKSWQRLTAANFSCPPLQMLQASLAEQNPAMVGAMLGMVAGIKGVSVQLLDLDMEFNDGMPEVRSASGIATLSADDPATLLMLASGMVPFLADIEVPADGTPVALPLPPEFGVAPMVAILGQHLVIYTGEGVEATVRPLRSEPLNPNGVLAVGFDYGRYGKVLQAMFANTGMRDNPDAAELEGMIEAFAASDLKLWMSSDILADGLLMRTRLERATR